jgi:hypothetical protein
MSMGYKKRGRFRGYKALSLIIIFNLTLAGLVFGSEETEMFTGNPRTPGIISIDPDQVQWGNPGSIVSVNFTVSNIIAGGSDIIDIDHTAEPNGWTVQVLKGDGSFQQLVNSGGDPTLPDVGPLNNGQSVNITVNVSIPIQPSSDSEFVNLTAQSNNNPNGFDNASVKVNVFPYLKIQKYMDPDIIYLKQSELGMPNETTIKLELEGAGVAWEEFMPQDTVFIIDSSGSMSWNDPNYIRLNATRDYIDKLTDEDRVAIVSCGHDYDLQPYPDAWWIGPGQYTTNYLPVGWLTDDMNTTNSTDKTPHHLTNMNTSGKTLMKSDLISLNAGDHPVYEDLTGGGALVGVATNLEMAIQFAHEELIPGYIAKVTTGPPMLDIPARPFTSDFSPGAKGDPSHQWLEILVTDGLPTAWNLGDNPANYTLDEVAVAAGNNTKMYTIGLLGSVLEPEKTQAENYLKSMANATGGAYFYADQPEDLLKVFDNISKTIKNVVAKPNTITGEPMVTDTIPGHIEVNISSFSKKPNFYFEDPTSHVKTIKWDVTSISINESWNVTYKINSTKAGLANITESGAHISYITWDDQQISVPVPDYLLKVVYLRPPVNSTVERINPTDTSLTWEDCPLGFGVDEFVVYGGPSPTTLDFTSPLSSIYNNNTWVHTNIISTSTEYYYAIRAKNTTLGGLSISSNTVGFWTRQFQQGSNSFAIPLAPVKNYNISWLADNVPNMNYIRWMETDGNWVRHNPSMTEGVNDIPVAPGFGYEVEVNAVTEFTFSGMPGASLRYREGQLPAPTGFNLSVNQSTGTVDLTWDQVTGADHYIIYRAGSRDGLNNLDLVPLHMTNIALPTETWYTDLGAMAVPGSEYYYTVAAVRFAGEDVGYNTSYSIGLMNFEYSPGYNTLGLPFRICTERAIDWYCNELENVMGMQYMDDRGVWKWHSKTMPAGVFDTNVDVGSGFQLAVISTTKVHYIYVGR